METGTQTEKRIIIKPKLRLPKLIAVSKTPTVKACPKLDIQGGCYYWPLPDYVAGRPIYAFDLDGTLVRTKSGRKFALDSEDWLFKYKEVPSKLIQLLKEGTEAYVIIITNQKGISSGKTKVGDITKKVWDLVGSLGPGLKDRFGLYIAGEADRYRKPWTGIWDLLPKVQLENVKWYCGDAAGRKLEKDFHASDRYFAENGGISFHTPEEIFLAADPPSTSNYVTYPASPYIGTESSAYEAQLQSLIERLKDRPRTLIIMVGGPGSGKSTLAARIKTTLSDAVHIERDSLGGNQKKFRRVVCAELENGLNNYVIADATHPNESSRADLKALIETTTWQSLIVHMDVPLELALHQDAVRVQLGHRQKPIPLVAHRTFYKRFREDESGRKTEQDAGGWITFSGRDPDFTNLPEYQMRFI